MKDDTQTCTTHERAEGGIVVQLTPCVNARTEVLVRVQRGIRMALVRIVGGLDSWLLVVMVVVVLQLLGHLSCVRHAAGGVPPNGHTDEETQYVYKMPGTAVQAQLGLGW